MLDRRSLLKLLALSPLAAAAARAGSASARSTRWKKKLVLVELAGGNDGMNTVIPVGDARYRKLRPHLGVDGQRVLGIGGGLALHPSLAKLQQILQAGDGGVVLGVGYPRPVRSHFRSADIWHTGSGSDEVKSDGWVARIAGGVAAKRGLEARGLVVGGGPGALDGAGFAALAAEGDRTSRRTPRPVTNAALAHLERVHDDVLAAHADIARVLGDDISERAVEGKAFVEQCRIAARALAGLDVAVVKVTLTGFDTHTNQRARHDALLRELANGLFELREQAKASGVWQDTIVATTSEFGRRAHENGSGGTDHGTAAPHFVLGGRVRSGLVGRQPSLDDLDGEGDVRFTTDFRALLGGLAVAAWDVRRDDAKAALGAVEPLVLSA